MSWESIFKRKLRQAAAELSRIDRQRLMQLLALEANWPAPARYSRNLCPERERFDYYVMQREHLCFLYKLVCRPAKPRRSIELRRYSAAGRELQRQVIEYDADRIAVDYPWPAALSRFTEKGDQKPI